MGDVTFHDDGSAAWSSTFVACPAGFNAYVAFNMAELAVVLDDRSLSERARSIARAMDEHLWDAEQGLWADLALVGGNDALSRVPISDGVMGALVTMDAGRADAALAQLERPHRFGAPFGPANVARSHPAYDPQMYWRGPAWPQLNYLLWLALRRWQRLDDAAALAQRTRQGAWRSGWAEYWDPETGAGLGAVPQSWAGLVVAMPAGD
jgi:glycogen debranching enzyme